MKKNNDPLVIVSLLSTYIFWSFGYFAIKTCVQTMPPLMMTGSRFIIGGAILLLLALLTGEAMPKKSEIMNSGIAGLFLIVGGVGLAAIAMVYVGSGITAIAISMVPIWMAVISGFFGHKTNKLEWTGLLVGFTGMILLNLEREMRSNIIAAVALALTPALWALGSVLNGRLKTACGLMGNAFQMMIGGVATLAIGAVRGEHFNFTQPTVAWIAYAYLLVFASTVGFSAYNYLLERVRPALASSYAYVNPIGAVIIGLTIAGEKMSHFGIIALVCVVSGVIFVMAGHREEPVGSSTTGKGKRCTIRQKVKGKR